MNKLLPTLVLTLSALFATGIEAQTLEKIKKDGSITLGHRDAALPFSYLDDKQQVIGYSTDVCLRIVDAVKAELGMPQLKVNLTPVNAATTIPLLANGTVDLVCATTTNNAERQKLVAYAPTTFVTGITLLSKKSSNIRTLDDMKGKTLVGTAGSTNIKLVTEQNNARNLGMTIKPIQDQPEAFLMVGTGRAAAYVQDDVLLYTQVATSKTPGDYYISKEPLSVEPYGIVLRKDDPTFKKVVDSAVIALMKSGELNKIYEKWFLSPIPPKGINLNIPMSAALKKAIANPTDSPNPQDYK